MDTNLILTTKLYPPRVTPDLVPRAQLLERLERMAHRPLTLISAPAGYGKSVLASMWLQDSGRPYGWVSLDEYDNDLPAFIGYLLAAVEAAVPEISLQQSQALLELPALPAVHVVARYLLNDLAQTKQPFFLALDDIHVIREYAIFDLLKSLLEHPSPALHLIIIGRNDPPLAIASLRAYGHISEIRVRDLRFTIPETAQFFKGALQQEISDAVAAEWAEKTEGWVVALRLAAISILSHGKTVWPGITFQGKNQYLQEYLLAEVLARLSPIKQACLLKISLLNSFCAPLCEVVCGELRETSRDEGLTGETFMQWLRQSNLFLIALDDNNEWFRFHHLFQSYLRNMLERQLDSQEIAVLHLRASKWLAGNNNIRGAIRHALKAGDTDTALSYFFQSRYQFMNSEQWIALDQLLNLFPDELVISDPVLSITKAYIALQQGPFEDLPRYLGIAKEFAAKLPADSPVKMAVFGEIVTLDGIMALIIGQADIMMASAEKALETLPIQARHARGVAIGVKAAGHQVAGNWQQGLSICQEAVADPNSSPVMRACALYYLCIVALMEGALPTILSSADQSLQLTDNHQLWRERGRRRYFLGIAYYQRNDFVNAEIQLLKTVKNPVTPPPYLAFAACALARLYRSQHRFDEADQVLQKANTHLDNIGELVFLEIIKAFQVELALDQNNLHEAQQLSLAQNFDLGLFGWFHYIPQLTPLKLLLHLGERENLEQAQIQLDAIENHVRSINRKPIHMDVLALQAIVYFEQDLKEKALKKLRESLLLGEPGGFIRNYVDLGSAMADLMTRLYQEEKLKRGNNLPYIEQILDAFPPPASQNSKNGAGLSINRNFNLTPRELETLNYLSTELSPEAIAAQMFISPATVRTHIRNVYAKLEVNGRFEAVHIAQKQGLL